MKQSFVIYGRLPGYNQLNSGHWAVKNRLKQESMRLVQIAAMADKIRPVKGQAKVRITCFEPNAKRDVDNVKAGANKIILDALQGIKIIEGDGRKYIVEVLNPQIEIDRKKPRIEVEIEQVN